MKTFVTDDDIDLHSCPFLAPATVAPRTTYNFLPDFLVCFSKQQVEKNFDFPVLTVASLKSGFLYET